MKVSSRLQLVNTTLPRTSGLAVEYAYSSVKIIDHINTNEEVLFENK